ncbi:MAG: PAS domain S-box protein [Roseiflexaceae bacterium]
MVAQPLDQALTQDIVVAEAFCRKLFQASSMGIVVVDQAGHIVLANAALAAMFGYIAEELIGQPLELLLPTYLRESHAVHRAAYAAEPQTRPMGEGMDLWGLRKDRQTFPLEVSLSSLFLGANAVSVAFVIDITARKQVEDALRASEERFRGAFEYAVIGMALVGVDGRWLQVNHALCDITGYAEHELLATTFQAITHPDDREADLVRVRRALAGEIYSHQVEKRYIHKNGDIVWVQLSSLLVRDERDQPLYFISQVQDITTRKQADEVRARLAAIVDSSDDGIIGVTLDGMILSWNVGAERIYGYTAEEMIGRSAAMLMLPGQLDELGQIITRIRCGERITHHEAVRIRKDGQPLDVALTISPIKDAQGAITGISAITRDIGERKRARQALHRQTTLRKHTEEALRAAEAQYRALVERIPAIIFVADADPNGVTHYISPQLEAILGFTPEEWLSDPDLWAKRLHPDDRAWVLSLMGSTRSGPDRAPIEYRLYTRDGRVRWFHSLTWVVQGEAQQPLLLQGILLDITERKHFEQALVEERALLARRVEERTADLSAANAELARTARLKDEFLASMSHELRTPLNAVLGLSEALQEQVYGSLNAAQLKALKNIEESGCHLLDLINDILDLAKIGAGKLNLALGPVVLGAICQASVRLIKPEAHKKHLTLETIFDPAVSLLRADARRLKQVMVNLLSNAVKFTPEGGTVGLEVVGDIVQQVVRLTVWDSGLGIAEEDLSRLFQPFVQLDSRLARQYNGTGLGLALVYRIDEMHGGSVSVTSEPGVGSRFTASLPWHSEGGAVEPSDVTLSPTAAPSARPAIRQALIVEDSPTAAAQLVRYLDELGVTAVTHPQGEDAITRVLEVQPDLIILDILLPDTSGWEVLERLKAEPRTQPIPVLIVSVMDDRSYGLALGAADYLVKPFTRQDVQEVLRRLGHPGGNAVDPALHVPLDQAPLHPTILLAEDNEANITTMLDYLRAKGYQVVVARNGAEAITRAREVRPAVILMDIQMPGMDGLEAIRRIRTQRNVAQTPIIALTALAMPGDRERCLAAGADDYLSKPVSLKRLAMAIQAQLQQYLARQGGRR